MNQKQLNNIAIKFIQNESLKVAKKIQGTLITDINERKEPIPGQALRHIHTLSLFDALAIISASCPSGKMISKEKARAYDQLAETLRAKYLEIAEQLRDFNFDENEN